MGRGVDGPPPVLSLELDEAVIERTRAECAAQGVPMALGPGQLALIARVIATRAHVSQSDGAA